jgi:beta-glucan synthesis-associated protein KRE6
LSACTCPGDDHPGPTYKTGRGAPEIDILEAQINVPAFTGAVSQSAQVAPFNENYYFDNSSSVTTIYNSTLSQINTYRGDQFQVRCTLFFRYFGSDFRAPQQAASVVSGLNSINYDNVGYATYAIEWWSDPDKRDDGYITWFSEGTETWKITQGSIGPDPATKISERLVSEEPMVRLNFHNRETHWLRSFG